MKKLAQMKSKNTINVLLLLISAMLSQTLTAQWTGTNPLVPRIVSDKVGIGTATPNTNTYLHLFHEDCYPSYTNLLRLSKLSNNTGVVEEGGSLFFDYTSGLIGGGLINGGLNNTGSSSHTPINRIEDINIGMDPGGVPTCESKFHWDLDINSQTGSLYFRNVIENALNGNITSNKDVMVLNKESVDVKTSLMAKDFTTNQANITNATIQNATVNNATISNLNGDVAIKGAFRIKDNSGTNVFAVYQNGNIRSRKSTVDLLAIPDYVFKKEYKLMSLKELEVFIKEKNHLPNIKSEEEYKKEGGIDLGELNVKLLEKVEELTLHLIEQNKKIEILEKKVLKK